jgi:hypothetical protein
MNNMFCPSPDRPMIQPNPENLKMRRWLRYVFYGQMYLIFVKWMLMNPLSGIF